jgi:hypothetical protein
MTYAYVLEKCMRTGKATETENNNATTKRLDRKKRLTVVTYGYRNTGIKQKDNK